MGEHSMIDTGVQKGNPFPGIRPFTSAEDKYFFGRDGVISDVLELLNTYGFVALTGASGSGKTSLIQSGIIPALLTREKQEWIPVSLRPGPRPMESLVRAFQQVFPKKLSEPDVQAFLAGSQDLGELIHEKGLGSHRYYLVVDQFEELFRFGPGVSRSPRDPDIRRFVDLLVKAAKMERPGINVMLSIRSDFIESCSGYRGLAELMNKSKYMLPLMSKDALAQSISGPVRQAGVRMEPGFTEYILEELEEVEYPLPVMQHAMMKTWDHWLEQGEKDQPLSINDYQNIGSAKTVISKHLDQIYDSLNKDQKLICERLFKSITAKSEQSNGYGKPAVLGNIARIAHCSLEDMVEVVEEFRQQGRAFLAPQPSQRIHADTMIGLSHESLIRIWERLQKWVDEEDESIKMYLKLSDASALYQQGRTELLQHPDLQIALNWRESQDPSPEWGVQFNPAFERAMVYLSTSEEEIIWEEERKVALQKRRLLINRAVAIFMAVLVLALGAIFVMTRNKPQVDQMVQSAAETTPGLNEASMANDQGTNLSDNDPVSVIMDEGQEEESDEYSEDLAATDAAEESSSRRDNSREEVVMADRESTSSTRNNRTSSSDRAVETASGSSQTRSEQDSRPATESGSTAAPAAALYVNSALDVAEQSLGIEKNPDLQGLLAYQAYLMNRSHRGKYYEKVIYEGLYAATKKLIKQSYNIYPSIRSSVKDVAWLNNTGSVLIVSSDGSVKILSGRFADSKSQINLTGTGLNNECLAVSPDEKRAVIGTNGGGLLLIELESKGDVILSDTENGNTVLFAENLGTSGSFVTAGIDNRILKWDYTGFRPEELVGTPASPSALGTSRDGKKLAFGTRDGKLYEMTVASPGSLNEIASFGRARVRSVAYSQGGTRLAVGLLDGSLRILGSNRSVLANLRGPGAQVSALAFSPDGRFLAAASHDGKVYLWNTFDYGHPPIVFDENKGFVLALCFSGNGSQFYTGSIDFPRFIGRPTEAAGMADSFCSLLGRNLSQEEWKQYFGENIPYEKTCPGLD